MQHLIRIVGRGKRTAKDLTYEEAREAAELILTGEATPLQIGAFFMAERVKMETTEELLGFVEGLRERSRRYPITGSIDCASPYDGRKKSFFATIPTAFVLAAAGVPAVLHGSESLPPKWGITLTDVITTLGVPVRDVAAETLERAADRTGFLFARAETWCPALTDLGAYREQLGVRTLLNTAEKLVRYTDAPYLVFGVFHGTVFEKVAELLLRVGVKRGLVVQGTEGSDDVTVEKRTRAFFVRDGEHEVIIIDPEALGVQAALPEVEWTSELQARTIEAVLRGEAEADEAGAAAYRQQVALNAGIRLWLAEKAPSIEEGVEAANRILQSGQAWDQYQDWKRIVLEV
jgi:anthranilate phosphoribosyltransferase